MRPKRVSVIVGLPKDDPRNYANRDIHAGEILWEFMETTYGCIGWNGIALSEEPNIYPFFEYPEEFVEVIDEP